MSLLPTNAHFYTADAQEVENVRFELAGQYINDSVDYYVDLT